MGCLHKTVAGILGIPFVDVGKVEMVDIGTETWLMSLSGR